MISTNAAAGANLPNHQSDISNHQSPWDIPLKSRRNRPAQIRPPRHRIHLHPHPPRPLEVISTGAAEGANLLNHQSDISNPPKTSFTPYR
jgi:hypothetical protein